MLFEQRERLTRPLGEENPHRTKIATPRLYLCVIGRPGPIRPPWQLRQEPEAPAFQIRLPIGLLQQSIQPSNGALIGTARLLDRRQDDLDPAQEPARRQYRAPCQAIESAETVSRLAG